MLRFATSVPKTLEELYERIRELLPQIEPKVITNMEIGTSETAVAHGLPFVPGYAFLIPHSCTMWCHTRFPDSKNAYFRAKNPVVADVVIIPISSK
jgi:hypothetical protein